ncbi:glycerol kinase GlpK [Ferrimonas balearica]|uniref:glycerol kinase GlpK n=1 Tax=Ferrimonas balearica TaxID=44012 RepID=UPI001C99AF68|nr:glycerol kinase GlpK [Ferrimonas balearica]MBY5994169.1 glycerol kinase GlpK [Ferrimonas balearica]
MSQDLYILALDQGTTSSRALLFNRQGEVMGSAQREFTQHYPESGWVEHDAMEIWASQRATLTEVLARCGVRHEQVAAIGITNQRETTVIWDAQTGQPIHNAIVWQCRRTAELCERLKQQGLEQHVRDTTGLVLDPYFSGTKIAWLLENVPGARARAERGELRFGTIDSWLLWHLTDGAVHATDRTNASRTLLWDIHQQRWDPVMLEALGIPASLLPEVRSSREIFGQAQIGQARIPVAGIAGDQQAALFGQLCTTPGMAKNTYGTGCFMLMHTGEQAVQSHHGLLTTIACSGPERVEYALEGSVFMGGASVQWLRDELGLIRHASETQALAESVPDTAGAYLVPAFTGLGAPYWDPYARGALVGLTRGCNRQHIVRATLESIAYQSRDLLDAMQQDAGLTLSELRVDGGAVANDFLMQFQADQLATPVCRPQNRETTAAGAAYLAGLAVGYWPSLEALKGVSATERQFTPQMEDARRQSLYQGWQAAVARTRGSKPTQAN